MTHDNVSSISAVSSPRTSLHLHRSASPPPTRSGSSGDAGAQASAVPSTGALPGVPQRHSTLSHLTRGQRKLTRDPVPPQNEAVPATGEGGQDVQVLQPYDVQLAFMKFQVVQTTAGMVQTMVQGFAGMSNQVCDQIPATVNALA